MSILGKRQDDEDDDLGGTSVNLPLQDMVCPTCGRDLAPWMDACPDDGATPVDRSHTTLSGVPDVPLHLLEGLEDSADPTRGDDRADVGDEREEGGAG